MGRNWNILTAELRDDPLGRGYAGMEPQQVADDLNARRYRRPLERTLVGLVRELSDAGHDGRAIGERLAGALQAATNNPLLAEIQQVLRSVSTLDWSRPEVRQVLGEFAAAEAIEPADRDAIFGLTDNTRSRADQLGLPAVPAAWVESYRSKS